MKKHALHLAVVLMLAGCAAEQRPNKPFTTQIESRNTQPDGSIRETHARVTGDENAKDKSSVTVTPDGVMVNTAGSAPFKWETITGDPLYWIGGGMIIAGLIFVGFKLSPYGKVLPGVPMMTGLYFAAGGAVVCILPFVGDGIRDNFALIVIVVSLIVVGGGLLWFYEYRNAKAKKDEEEWRVKMEAGKERLLTKAAVTTDPVEASEARHGAGALELALTGNEDKARLIAHGEADGVKEN